MRIVQIIFKIQRESTGKHVLDCGDDRLEIILSRDESVNMVTLDTDDLVNTIVVSIHLQTVELQALVVIGEGKVRNLDVACRVVKRVPPERSGSVGRKTTVRIFVIET